MGSVNIFEGNIGGAIIVNELSVKLSVFYKEVIRWLNDSVNIHSKKEVNRP